MGSQAASAESRSQVADPKDRIPAEWPEFDPRQMLRVLVEAGVDFVVIGGIAVIISGYGRATRDLDIAFAGDAANLEALGGVLTKINARLRGIAEDVPFEADARTLAGIQLLTLETDLGWLDVHRTVGGVSNYERLNNRAERVLIDELPVLIAGLEDLMAMKRAAGRPQDLIDLHALEAIKRVNARRRS